MPASRSGTLTRDFRRIPWLGFLVSTRNHVGNPALATCLGQGIGELVPGINPPWIHNPSWPRGRAGLVLFGRFIKLMARYTYLFRARRGKDLSQ